MEKEQFCHCAIAEAGVVLCQKLIGSDINPNPKSKRTITVSFLKSGIRTKNQTKIQYQSTSFSFPLKTIDPDPIPEEPIQILLKTNKASTVRMNR
ncbi:MAG: hypothetical protein EON98_10340 [Chitinophagaceae bacterium]|nr:MAG: hypothetical protein EON98_10340 [Chitinophagaceae bacterium]